MKKGVYVEWKYKHSKHKGRYMIKRGEYIGLIRHTYKHGGPQLALVHFDGNKRASKIPVEELKVIEGENP